MFSRKYGILISLFFVFVFASAFVLQFPQAQGIDERLSKLLDQDVDVEQISSILDRSVVQMTVHANDRTVRSQNVAHLIASETNINSSAFDIHFSDEPWPAEAKAAFRHAAAVWSLFINVSVPIEINAYWESLDDSVIGQSDLLLYRDFWGAPVPSTYYPGALANQMAGYDIDLGYVNAAITVASNVDWYFDIDGNPSAQQCDLVTLAMKMIGGALGFVTSFQVDAGGLGRWGLVDGYYIYPIIHDRFVVNEVEQYLTNTGLFPNPSSALAAQLVSNAVFFNGSSARAANSGTAPQLYAPNPWESGRSIGYLDEGTFPLGNANALMTPLQSYGEAIHNPGPVALGVLRDLGWTTQSTYSITGHVRYGGGNPVPDVTVSAGPSGLGTTDSDGAYNIINLAAGTYFLTSEKSGWVFTPAKREVSMPPDATDQDFTALDELGDADGDGLLNAWEVQGYDFNGDGSSDVDLPAMGADPLKKDIFVEIDYMEKRNWFGISHQPKPQAIDRVVKAFADAPVPNPDGSQGINLHVDHGPNSVMNPVTGEKWDARSEANPLDYHTEFGRTCGPNCYDWGDFCLIKADNFLPERVPVFHYAVFAHYLGGSRCISGMAITPGRDFIVSLGGWGLPLEKQCFQDHPVFGDNAGEGTIWQQAGTFMHELGHNLGLNHGGRDRLDYKPNYLSIMNYPFQMRGLIIDGDEGHFDYSRFELLRLREYYLNETHGLSGGNPAVADYGIKYWWCGSSMKSSVEPVMVIDWNCDGDFMDEIVVRDINRNVFFTDTLESYIDWDLDHLVFSGGTDPCAGQNQLMQTEGRGITLEEDAEFPTLYGVSVTAGNLMVLPGSTVVCPVNVANFGINTDTYTITTSSSLGWADLSNIPTSLTLPAEASTVFSITVSVPASADLTEVDELIFLVASHSNPLLEDVAIIHTNLACQVFLPVLFKNY